MVSELQEKHGFSLEQAHRFLEGGEADVPDDELDAEILRETADATGVT
jgi:hypothetical protein